MMPTRFDPSKAGLGLRAETKFSSTLTALVLSSVTAFALPGCSRQDSMPASSPRVASFGQAISQGGGHHKLGAPYVVNGIRYVPRYQPHYDQIGLGSWYGRDFHGRLTANGEIYDMGRITAAHPTLPLPSLVRVTNLRNGRSVIVRINDRGPFVPGRIIDLSHQAARALGFVNQGLARVRVQYVVPLSCSRPAHANTITRQSLAFIALRVSS